MTRIKVCGLTNTGDIQQCVTAGAHALGFVVEYPIDVPWNLDRNAAMDLMGRVPPYVTKVIIVGDDPATVTGLTEKLRPHVVQLHGNEPIALTARLVSGLKSGFGVQIVKALRFSAETGECFSEVKDPIKAGRMLEQAGVDALLLDSVSSDRPAGTGKTLDWGMARRIRDQMSLPVILAGGLNAGNVGRAISCVSPYGVDVISGVEDPVGKKDPDKLKAFFKAIYDVWY